MTDRAAQALSAPLSVLAWVAGAADYEAGDLTKSGKVSKGTSAGKAAANAARRKSDVSGVLTVEVGVTTNDGEELIGKVTPAARPTKSGKYTIMFGWRAISTNLLGTITMRQSRVTASEQQIDQQEEFAKPAGAGWPSNVDSVRFNWAAPAKERVLAIKKTATTKKSRPAPMSRCLLSLCADCLPLG